MRHPALFERFPSLRERVPFRPLGHLPTPVQRIEGVAAGGAELWVKRDDACGGSYGGNKLRKLEFLLGDVLARGKRWVLTVGAYGSHHVLATAILGAEVGLFVDAVVYPQPITPHVLETFRAGVGAGCRYHLTKGWAGVLPSALTLLARPGTAWIPPGGSSPLGTLGYVSAGLEIAAQIEAGECPRFDVVYVALGSCGTAAGLLLGLRLAGLATRVVAVRVVDPIVCNRAVTLRLARATARLLEARGAGSGIESGFEPGEFRVEPGFFGGQYGRPTEASVKAVERAARAGLTLETTYTGKAFAALLADLEAGRLEGQRVLFMNTFSSTDLGKLLAKGTRTLPPRLARLLPAG